MSTDTPVKLVPKDAAVVRDDVLATLELVTNRAKNGEFAGIVVVATLMTGGSYSTFSSDMDRMKTLGLLEYVKWRMMSQEEENRK